MALEGASEEPRVVAFRACRCPRNPRQRCGRRWGGTKKPLGCRSEGSRDGGFTVGRGAKERVTNMELVAAGNPKPRLHVKEAKGRLVTAESIEGTS